MNPLQVAALVLLVIGLCILLYISAAYRAEVRETTAAPTDKDAEWARRVLADAGVEAPPSGDRVGAIKTLRASDPALSLPDAARLVREVAGDA